MQKRLIKFKHSRTKKKKQISFDVQIGKYDLFDLNYKAAVSQNIFDYYMKKNVYCQAHWGSEYQTCLVFDFLMLDLPM